MIEYSPIAESKNFIVLDRYERSSVVNEAYQSEDALEREFIDDLQKQGIDFVADILHERTDSQSVRVGTLARETQGVDHPRSLVGNDLVVGCLLHFVVLGLLVH